MSALDRLEKVAGISIFNKLAPKFLEMASTLDFNESALNSFRQENNPVEGSKDMMKAWLSGKSSLPSTWQVLLEKLQAVERELTQEIKHFLKVTPVTSLSLSLVSLCMCWFHIGACTMFEFQSFLIDIWQQEGRVWARLVCNWEERATDQARLQRSSCPNTWRSYCCRDHWYML